MTEYQKSKCLHRLKHFLRVYITYIFFSPVWVLLSELVRKCPWSRCFSLNGINVCAQNTEASFAWLHYSKWILNGCNRSSFFYSGFHGSMPHLRWIYPPPLLFFSILCCHRFYTYNCKWTRRFFKLRASTCGAVNIIVSTKVSLYEILLVFIVVTELTW